MQIIDLRDTDKSQYFAITESNNCLSFDRQVSFHILITSWQLREVICHFSQRAWLQLRMSRILFAAKHVLNDTTHEQTIICRQLFAGHVVGSWPMERKKTMRRMIISFTCIRDENSSALQIKAIRETGCTTKKNVMAVM